jgi:hypothetical protein
MVVLLSETYDTWAVKRVKFHAPFFNISKIVDGGEVLRLEIPVRQTSHSADFWKNWLDRERGGGRIQQPQTNIISQYKVLQFQILSINCCRRLTAKGQKTESTL